MACHSGLCVISFSSIRCDALSFCRSALPCVTASMRAQGILIASIVCRLRSFVPFGPLSAQDRMIRCAHDPRMNSARRSHEGSQP